MIVLAALAVAVALLIILNKRNTDEKRQFRTDEIFQIRAGGEEYTITLEEFLGLEQREFQAVLKKNGKPPEDSLFTGVPFAQVLRGFGIDAGGYHTAVFTAADGYASALPLAGALDETNCFIVADSGGDGPFRMVMAKDRFSQRWCKLLVEVVLK